MHWPEPRAEWCDPGDSTERLTCMPIVENAGASIYWESRGQGEAVLLITGLGSVMEQWRRIEPALSDRYRTIRFDNRGMGHTSVPPGPYSIEAMADDAAAVLD